MVSVVLLIEGDCGSVPKNLFRCVAIKSGQGQLQSHGILDVETPLSFPRDEIKVEGL